MTNLIGLTELIFIGKTLIIYMLIYQTFGNQLETKTATKINKKMHIQAKKMSAPLHTKVTAWT